MDTLKNKQIAILAENGFEESELTSPKDVLEKSGAIVTIVSPREGKIKSWKDDNWGIELPVDVHISEANAEDYHGLLIPGGVANPDLLRRSEPVINFVKSFFANGKPIASICHGPQVLIETGALEGRTMTSFPSIRTDLENAGVKWVDEEVVVDAGLVTSRTPDDLEAFNAKMVEEFAEGMHEEQMTV